MQHSLVVSRLWPSDLEQISTTRAKTQGSIEEASYSALTDTGNVPLALLTGATSANGFVSRFLEPLLESASAVPGFLFRSCSFFIAASRWNTNTNQPTYDNCVRTASFTPNAHRCCSVRHTLLNSSRRCASEDKNPFFREANG